MKRKLLTFISILFFATSLFSQCVVEADFSDVEFGFSPDSINDFALATLDNIYAQQLDVKIPPNGAPLTPSLPFVTVDSVLVTGITNLPPGLSYECTSSLSTPCAYEGGSTGCAVISGIPTQAGVFDLVLNIEFYTSIGAQPIALPISGYQIIVEDPLSVDDSNISYSELLIVPNPVQDVFKLRTNSKESGSASFRVYDLLGQEVLFRDVFIKSGDNILDVDVAHLPEGVYITRLDAFGHSRSSRLVVIE